MSEKNIERIGKTERVGQLEGLAKMLYYRFTDKLTSSESSNINKELSKGTSIEEQQRIGISTSICMMLSSRFSTELNEKEKRDIEHILHNFTHR